ncbi:MAG: rhomboid family intramembrane serine protease [Candidatus Micrarchaeota archaeon]
MVMVVPYLIAITALIFFADTLMGGLLSKFFALTPALVATQPWTLVTSMFLHGSILHIFFNMFGLLMFGPFLETKVGKKNFLLIYFASGIMGNLGYIFTAGLGSTVPVIGASGAIFGVLGALALLQPNMMVFVGFIPMPIYMAAIFWFFMELTSGVTGSEPGIANFAHVFGLAGGLAIANRLKKEVIKKGRWLNADD